MGNKYPFDASKKTFKRNRLEELTQFNALEITLIQQVFVKTLQARVATVRLTSYLVATADVEERSRQ